jgi:hypothetical protein
MSSERFRPAETPSEATPGLERASGGRGEAARREQRARDEASVGRQEPGGHGPDDAGTGPGSHGAHGSHGHGEEVELRPGWSRPKPEHVPHPTYWPAVLALGLTFAIWGLITSYVISVVGLVLFAIGLSGWIGELRHGA